MFRFPLRFSAGQRRWCCALVVWEAPPIGQDSSAHHCQHALQLTYSLQIQFKPIFYKVKQYRYKNTDTTDHNVLFLLKFDDLVKDKSECLKSHFVNKMLRDTYCCWLIQNIVKIIILLYVSILAMYFRGKKVKPIRLLHLLYFRKCEPNHTLLESVPL